MRLLPHIPFAGALAIASGLATTAAAQDCRLALSASDHFLTPGETTEVHAWAHFPPTVYAFASASFDVVADIPGWSFATSGVIAGDSVLDAKAGQPHQPHIGLPADPTNPLRIWSGTFKPDTWEPRCVAIEATPSGFEVYPSPLTGSPAPCPAEPGATRVIINPVVVGNVAFAPIEATPMRAMWHHAGGVHILFGDGSVHPVGGAVRIGLLVPAIQKVRQAAARIQTTGNPESLGIIAILIGLLHDIPTEEIALTYQKIDLEYKPTIDLAAATGSRYLLFRSGRLIGEHTSPDGVAPFVLGGLPDAHEIRLGDDPRLDIHTTMLFDQPIPCIFPGEPGRLIDRVEVVTSTSINNLKQIGIAMHTYHAEPGREPVTLSVIADVACRADLTGDGSLDFFDFLAFQNLFAGGDPFADFSGDSRLDFFDFLAFQNEFSRGCP